MFIVQCSLTLCVGIKIQGLSVFGLIRHSYHQFDLKMKAVFFTGFFVFSIIGTANSQLSAASIAERLNEIASTRFVSDISNEALECIWNDWEERDSEAKKHGTYDFCRYFTIIVIALFFLKEQRL